MVRSAPGEGRFAEGATDMSASESWSRIDAWLSAHAPTIAAKLRPGLDGSSEAVEELRSALDELALSLPQALELTWRAHDGAQDEHPTIFSIAPMPPLASWAVWMWLLPAANSLQRYHFMLGLKVGWSASWLPIGEDGGGNVLIVDASTEAVSIWDHETAELIAVAPKLEGWLGAIASRLESGEVAEDPNEEQLVIVMPEPAAPPVPDTSERRIATTFIQLLLEQELLELEPDGDGESLITGVEQALRARNKTSALLELLETHPAVADFFVDDETLAELVREFS